MSELHAESIPTVPESFPRPPLVTGKPLVGNLLDMASNPAAFFVRCYQTHGPIFRIKLFNSTVVVMAGPEANQFISREGSSHLRSKEFWQGLVDEFGARKSLINTDGEIHAQLRKVMKRGFSRGTVQGQLKELIGITDDMLDRDWQTGRDVEVVRAMQRMAAEQLGIMATGKAPGEYVNDLRLFIQTVLSVNITRHWPRIMLYSPAYRRAKRRVFELGQKMIDGYDPNRGESEPRTLIDDIMAARAADSTLFEGNELMMAVLGPYFAGLDTVANITSAILYATLKHPEVYARVIEEVDRVFAAGPPTSEALGQMPALHGTVMEALRMYPIAVAAMRNATRDFVFAGHQVLADEPVYIAVTVCHFLPEFFVEPTRFDIDRFHPPRNEHRQRGAFAPFSLGEHTCLGAGMAEVQMMLTMATLFHRLRMELVPANYELKLKVVPTPGPEMKFRVRVTGRRHAPAASS